jgi:hypothetical protein
MLKAAAVSSLTQTSLAISIRADTTDTTVVTPQ